MNTSFENDAQTPGAPAHASRRFLLVLLCCSTVLYLLPFLLVRLPVFAHFSKSQVEPSMKYVLDTPHIDADVVILGDSSAMHGLDPLLMSGDLQGVRVINLANQITTLPVMAEVELRRYLKQNRRPRILVFYGAPWEADFLNQQEGKNSYAGEEMLFRHGTAAEIVSYVLRHPDRSAAFSTSFYSLNVGGFRPGATPPKVDTLGHLSFPWRTLQDTCALPEAFLKQSGDVETVQHILSEFQAAADHVIYYAAPVPVCKSTRGMLRTPYALLGARPSLQYPAAWFMDDRYFIHPSYGAGVEAASHDLSSFLAHQLESSANKR